MPFEVVNEASQNPQVLLGVQDLGHAVAVRNAEVPRRSRGRLGRVPTRRDIAVWARRQRHPALCQAVDFSSARPTCVRTVSSCCCRFQEDGVVGGHDVALVLADDRSPGVLRDQCSHHALIRDGVFGVVAHARSMPSGSHRVPARATAIHTSAPAPRTRRNQLTPAAASHTAHTPRPATNTARPRSWTVPCVPAGEPPPRERHEQRRVRELHDGEAARPAHLATPPERVDERPQLIRR